MPPAACPRCLFQLVPCSFRCGWVLLLLFGLPGSGSAFPRCSQVHAFSFCSLWACLCRAAGVVVSFRGLPPCLCLVFWLVSAAASRRLVVPLLSAPGRLT